MKSLIFQNIILLFGIEFITIFISSTIITISIIKFAKYAADRGYKINTKYKSNFTDRFNNFITFFILCIPFLNVAYSLYLLIGFLVNKSGMYNCNKRLGYIKQMNELEKEEYNKNPTGAYALSAETDAQRRIDNALKLSYRSGNRINEIFYEYDEKSKQIKILKTTGTLSNLSKEEQEEKVRQLLKGIIASDIRKNCIQELKEETHKIIDDVKEEYPEDVEYIHSLTYENDKGTSEILFDLDDNVDKLNIIKVTGFLESLPLEEQEQLVYKTVSKFVVKGYQQFDDIEEFKEHLKSNYYELKLDEYTVKYKVITKK